MKISKRKLILICSVATILLVIAGALIWLFAFYLPSYREQQEIQLFMREYYNTKLQQFREENAALDGDVDVVFLGDSLTDGYDLSTYYPQYRTLNRGIGGDTTNGLYARLDVSLYTVRPKVAVMLIGVNNIDTMLDNYETILKGFQENVPDTKIVLLSLTSMSGDWAFKNEKAAYNNTYIKKYAETYGYAYVDLYTALLDVSTGEMKTEYTIDGGHFTAKGYEVLTAEITPVLQSILGY